MKQITFKKQVKRDGYVVEVFIARYENNKRMFTVAYKGFFIERKKGFFRMFADWNNIENLERAYFKANDWADKHLKLSRENEH
ncbi:MAG TPA: hypothetical protein VMV86_05805 [Methanosarcinales archaeon]|nr:hypothetical protein [Methanosarcinales archaeon]